MLSKLYRFFEYGYLLAAAFFAYEAINNWSTERGRSYLFACFVVVAIFMYFFKRNFRKKMEDQNKDV